jgi:hypothetical protein
MLPLKFVLDGIRAMSPGHNQARQGCQRDSKDDRPSQAQRHDRENASIGVTAATATLRRSPDWQRVGAVTILTCGPSQEAEFDEASDADAEANQIWDK